jgi:hypothetical protein
MILPWQPSLKDTTPHITPTNKHPAYRFQWLLRNVNIGRVFRAFINALTSMPMKSMIQPTIQLDIHHAPSVVYSVHCLSLKALPNMTLYH